MKYVAHVRKDRQEQSLGEHLHNVAKLAGQNAEKFELEVLGELLGLLHDVGKYSAAFQDYIGKATNDQDCDEVDHLKGKIDHSTAGAQYVNEKFSDCDDKKLHNVSKLISLCLASHHSGLIDCVAPNGEDKFSKRIAKGKALSHYEEVFLNVSSDIKRRIDEILDNNSLVEETVQKIMSIIANDRAKYPQKELELRVKFKVGILARMLLSCLVDADHSDTADFENPAAANLRFNGKYENWESLSDKLEHYLRKSFNSTESEINRIRTEISDEAKARGERAENGLFTLTVPTGGGKTLASLRFALSHAKNNPKIQRIIYVIPYTSIIDQNADVARKIFGSSVLEHHSNLSDEKDTWKNKVLSENWDAPIVFTTMVQFLDSMFGAGTRDVRRMHKLANSVIIFDEIQTLPIRLVHMFCNTVNFLADTCNSTIVLCTATQPLFGKVNEEKGNIPSAAEIAPNVEKLFEKLKRVELVDLTKKRNQAWSCAEVAELAIEKQREATSCLVVVNTTKTARIIHQTLKEKLKDDKTKILHLSARMCAAHRIETLKALRDALDDKTSLICVSTQVIEAGVDVDFGAGIRSLAGLDSVAQSAGRVNRNGKATETAKLYLVNIGDDEEYVSRLKDIKIGQEKTERVLREIQNKDMFSPDVVEIFYKYYFYERSEEMLYYVKMQDHPDNLLNMLSVNGKVIDKSKNGEDLFLQSFKSASEKFNAIDSDTKSVVVPYSSKGKNIISKLCSEFDSPEFFKILREAQKYSVNVYENRLKKLPVNQTSEGSGIFYVSKEYYSEDFGLCDEKVSEMELLHIEEGSHE